MELFLCVLCYLSFGFLYVKCYKNANHLYIVHGDKRVRVQRDSKVFPLFIKRNTCSVGLQGGGCLSLISFTVFSCLPLRWVLKEVLILLQSPRNDGLLSVKGLSNWNSKVWALCQCTCCLHVVTWWLMYEYYLIGKLIFMFIRLMICFTKTPLFLVSFKPVKKWT